MLSASPSKIQRRKYSHSELANVVALHERFRTGKPGGVRAMLARGVAAVVAYSFDPGFARAALERGLPALEVYEALAIHTGATLRVDLEGTRVVNMSSGDRYPIRNVDDAYLARFRQADA